jgi:hypothetical protein
MSSNKILTNFLFLTTLTCVLYSCCTKKLCLSELFPAIAISFSGFTKMELLNCKIYLLDKKYNVLDSSLFLLVNNTGYINPNTFSNNSIEPSSFFYIIKTSKNDTIFDISYNKNLTDVKCNKCFLFGNGDETITVYENFSFRSKGKTYSKGDTLKIYK